MFRKPVGRWRFAAAMLAVIVLALPSCGGSAPQRDAPAGATVHLRGVAYAARVSRALNPDSGGDHPFFAGVPGAGRRLPPDQVWVGVFLQVQNDSGAARRASGSITLFDRSRRVLRPVPLPVANVYAYRPAMLAPGDTDPGPSSPAGSSPEQGGLVLFHVPVHDLMQGATLVLRIADRGQLASVRLDI